MRGRQDGPSLFDGRNPAPAYRLYRAAGAAAARPKSAPTSTLAPEHREIFELIDQHFERALFPALRRDLERRVAILCRQTKQSRDQRRGLFELARAAR
jgi:hypothetical protein